MPTGIWSPAIKRASPVPRHRHSRQSSGNQRIANPVISQRRTTNTWFALLLLAWLPLAQATPCLPIYGNWCGPGQPADGTTPPPVDAFDATCMRHDPCLSEGMDETLCDRFFVVELRSLAGRFGYLPRALQWAEYAIRVKSGGTWGDMPAPLPGDALGFLGSLVGSCR